MEKREKTVFSNFFVSTSLESHPNAVLEKTSSYLLLAAFLCRIIRTDMERLKAGRCRRVNAWLSD